MGGAFARYWIMGSKGYDAAANAYGEGGNESETSSLDQKLHMGSKRLRESNEEWRRSGQAQRGADYDNEFVKDMQWVEFMDGKDHATIAAATRWIGAKARRVPEEDATEKLQLTKLCESVKREVERCQQRIYAVPKAVRRLLHGIEDGKGNPIPFKMNQGSNILSKYSIVCQRYICFCWRAYTLGREEARAKLGMRFTDDQWSLICDMGHALWEMEGNDSGEESDGNDSDAEGDR